MGGKGRQKELLQGEQCRQAHEDLKEQRGGLRRLGDDLEPPETDRGHKGSQSGKGEGDDIEKMTVFPAGEEAGGRIRLRERGEANEEEWY